MPKISLQDTVLQRSVLRQPQLADSWCKCRRFLRLPVSASGILSSRPLTFQFVAVSSVPVVVEVFWVFSPRTGFYNVF